MDYNELFKHLYVDNGKSKTLFLLHGTGGDEKDLMSLTRGLRDQYNFVGLRGNVVQDEMNRFFIRFEDGSFDEESIRTEVEKLHFFVMGWSDDHADACEEIAFAGYSNGANMILALALSHSELVRKAVLFHGKLPLVPAENLKLNSSEFLVTYGEADKMILPQESLKMIEELKNAGAKVTVLSHDGGHEIVRDEVTAMEQFLI